MHDFRMKLEAVDALLRVPHRGYFAIIGFAENLESRRHADDVIAVAHPDLVPPGHAVKEPTVSAHPQRRAAKLLGLAAIHGTPEVLGDDLVPVANPEHRLAEREQTGVRFRPTRVENAGGPARQDHALMGSELGRV